ncbi:hypothetical protein [Mycolicibacterium sphagni]|uniref:hypothetical protein n=1 Tax=Mycolicibacterium sphagni TaxID=1786 RepID=UPI0013FDEF2F|nr:hypothetical protein [Mycolicibacterium sphagni]
MRARVVQSIDPRDSWSDERETQIGAPVDHALIARRDAINAVRIHVDRIDLLTFTHYAQVPRHRNTGDRSKDLR